MATFIIGSIVFVLLFLAVFSLFKKSKNNSGSCGSNCPGCTLKSSCNSKVELKK